MLLRERNLSSSETQKKKFDMINCEFHKSYISFLLRKQGVLFTAISKCANASAKDALMLKRSLLYYIYNIAHLVLVEFFNYLLKFLKIFLDKR